MFVKGFQKLTHTWVTAAAVVTPLIPHKSIAKQVRDTTKQATL